MAGFTLVCYGWGESFVYGCLKCKYTMSFLRHNSGSLSLLVVRLNAQLLVPVLLHNVVDCSLPTAIWGGNEN